MLFRLILACWLGAIVFFCWGSLAFEEDPWGTFLRVAFFSGVIAFLPLYLVFRYQMLAGFPQSWGVYYLPLREAVFSTTSPRSYRVQKVSLYDLEKSTLHQDLLEGLEGIQVFTEARERDLYQVDAILLEDSKEVEGENGSWLFFQKKDQELWVKEGDLLASLINSGGQECYALNLGHCHFEGSHLFVPQQTCLVEKNFMESTIFQCWWGAMVPFAGYGRPWLGKTTGFR